MQLSAVQTNIFLALLMAAVIHGIYLAILLLVKSRREDSLSWLGIMMIPLSLLMLNYLLFIGNWMVSVPHLLGVFAPVFYLMGPALYFFVSRSLPLRDAYKWYDLLHLLPFLYVLIQWIPVYGWTAAAKVAVIEQVYQQSRPSLGRLLLGNLYLFFVLAYTVAAYLKVRSSKDGPHPRRKWLLRFSSFFAFFLLLDLGINGVFWLLQWDGALMELSLVVALAVATHMLGYVVLGYSRIMPDRETAAAHSKYTHSRLDTSIMESYREDILAYLEKERPWMKPGFSMDDLSADLQIPRHHISQVLNEGLEISFYDLISQYRIREVRKRLLAGDAQKFSIYGIASDCGFGSKSSFNRAFKKISDTTPTEWLKTLARTETSSQ